MSWRVPRWWPDSGLFRRRGAALVLTITLEGLLVLLLLYLVPPVPPKPKPATTKLIVIEPKKEEPEFTRTVVTHAKARADKAAMGKPKPEPVIAPPPPEPAKTAVGPPPFIVMTRDELRAADIANIPQRAAAPASSGLAGQGDSVPGTGRGPGGELLYNAEWYRRPRQVELNAYLPRGWAREGTGVIACRTVARYRVEDCRILGESPRGSGYGNAVLQAAFQFLVRPPRVGGKDLVGAWVTIRIDYSILVK